MSAVCLQSYSLGSSSCLWFDSQTLHCPAPGTPLADGVWVLIPAGSLWRKGDAWEGDSCAWPKLFLGGAPLPQPGTEGASRGQLGSVGRKTWFPVTPFIFLFFGYPVEREAVCKRLFWGEAALLQCILQASVVILITTTSRFLLFKLCLIVVTVIQKGWDIQVAEWKENSL